MRCRFSAQSLLHAHFLAVDSFCRAVAARSSVCLHWCISSCCRSGNSTLARSSRVHSLRPLCLRGIAVALSVILFFVKRWFNVKKNTWVLKTKMSKADSRVRRNDFTQAMKDVVPPGKENSFPYNTKLFKNMVKGRIGAVNQLRV